MGRGTGNTRIPSPTRLPWGGRHLPTAIQSPSRSVSWTPDPFPHTHTPTPSAGPDPAQQRFASSPAVPLPRASPRRNAEGRIISDIISLILNEALLPQLPASPPGFRRP